MIIFSDEQLAEWQEEASGFVLPELSEKLLIYYEISRLSDCIPIRADKYESPEHAEERKKFEEPPLGIQNPNFSILQELVENLHKKPGDHSFSKLSTFVKNFTEYQEQEYNHIPDIRSIKDLDLLMAYLRGVASPSTPAS